MNNFEELENSIRGILNFFGVDPTKESTKDTPERATKMLLELLEGMQYTNKQIAEMFGKCFDGDNFGELVVAKDIPIFSLCEHHLALMYNMKVTIGYIPNGKVIGLSKLSRIADMCSRRLQLQERIGTDIYEVLKMVLGTEDIIVLITGEHSCVTARGVKKPGTTTQTVCSNGAFHNIQKRTEFYSLIKN